MTLKDEPRSRKIKSQTILFKTGLIVIITLILLYPSSRINNLITERQLTKEETTLEIGKKWGKHQTIIGPILTIPYLHSYEVNRNGEKTTRQAKKQIHILPEHLSISNKINPETLHRGIFEVAVYDSQSTLVGSFENFSIEQLGLEQDQLLLEEAFLSVGISDLRGIQNQVEFLWGENHIDFQSGTLIKDKDFINSGIMAHVPVNFKNDTLEKRSFQISLNLKGSEKMYVTPVGKTSNIIMESNWPSPSFNGKYLPNPETKVVNDEGFFAEWKIIDLNRNFPQAWFLEKYPVSESAFGVDLFIPADNYQRSERSIKYAILFIGLTFMVFFLTEIINKTSIHPIQYVLIGSALVIFYILLVSFSEHLTFNWSYLISSISIITLIGLYTQSVFKNRKFSIMLSSILCIMYTFIYIIIQMEDFALLSGSIGLFIILASTMYYSRKIDWYAMNNLVKI